MSVGIPVSVNDVNQRVGTIAIAIREQLDGARQFKAWLDTQSDAQLIALPAGGAPATLLQADVNVLRSAIADLNDLNLVYQGLTSAHVTGTYDYRTFSKLLTGLL